MAEAPAAFAIEPMPLVDKPRWARLAARSFWNWEPWIAFWFRTFWNWGERARSW
jgi:hypothetical protein